MLRPDSEWLAKGVEVLQWGRMRDVTIMDKLRQLLPGALFGADDRRWCGCGGLWWPVVSRVCLDA